LRSFFRGRTRSLGECPVCGGGVPLPSHYCMACGVSLVQAVEFAPGASDGVVVEVEPLSEREWDVLAAGKRRVVPLEAVAAMSSYLAIPGSSTGALRLGGLSQLGFMPKEYQVAVASRVLSQMHGRAILADEVGLGKTIEAGLVMHELRHRGLSGQALVLVPSSLVEQWREELEDKFGFRVALDSTRNLKGKDVLLLSLQRAKMEPLSRRLQSRRWDLLVVDEAHSLKNSRTLAHRFVRGLDARYLLLLTATPIENDLREIFNLLTLVNPAAYSSFRQFSKDFLETRFKVRDVGRLRDFCSRFLLRNRRVDVIPEMPPRYPRLVSYYQHGQEKRFYESVLAFVRKLARKTLRTPQGQLKRPGGATASSVMLFLTLLLKESCSSPQAVAASLRSSLVPGLLGSDLQQLQSIVAQGEEIRKTGKMIRFMKAIRAYRREPAIAYVEFMATHSHLTGLLEKERIPVIPYTGRLSSAEKVAALQRFKEKGGVLLCTEVGGQGLNLQHCNVVINYDLPWNPMRLEQRIGRVHRFGQERTVHIVNFISTGTYEEYVYDIIVKKLDLFRQVIGEVDAILSFMDEEDGIEHSIARAIYESESDEEMRGRFTRLVESVSQAADRYRKSMRATFDLFDTGGSGWK